MSVMKMIVIFMILIMTKIWIALKMTISVYILSAQILTLMDLFKLIK